MKFTTTLLTLLLSTSTALACTPFMTYCYDNLSDKDKQVARDFVQANVRKLGVPGGYTMTERKVLDMARDHMWECQAGFPPKPKMAQYCKAGKCKSRFARNDACEA